MAQDKPVIQLQDVCKSYKMGPVEVKALCNINLEVREGEFLAIMGASGSGKSTMVQNIGCLDLPTRGTIFLNGQDISHMTESELAQVRGRMIGFIFQQFNLIQTLTALENVMLPMIFQGVPESERRKKAIELLTLVELGERMNHLPNELSGGQQQRVAIARSLANDPEVILADEPTGNLDSKTGMIVLDYLGRLHKKGKTIIMVTHDKNVAKAAERIIYLKDGLIVKNL